MAAYSRDNTTNNVLIVKTESVENYTEYTIEVRIDEIRWLVNHRYSEFNELNEQLVAEYGIDKKLLPPKKVFGNTSESFIQKRRSGLERYLQQLLKQFERIPFQLAMFLEFQKYEINGVTQILAETLFSRGDALLEKESTCSMDPLQLHAITERMTKPETVVSHHTRDIGHILDFVTHLHKLRIVGTDKPVGTSNLNMNDLNYSVAMFKNIKYLELVKCNITPINGLDHIRNNIEKLKLKKSITSIQEFLTHNVRYWEDDVGGEESQTNITWPKLTWVDMSENSITELPESMRYLERMEYLDLHDNYLMTIENLEAVSYLTHLDVSINRIERLTDLHLRLGNVKTMNLSGNKLETLEGFSKLYSLEYLDVSNNQISQVLELRCLGSLPLLETLTLTGNPVTVIPDYRIQVLKVFVSRAKEVTLDNKKGVEKELDTVAVLIALDHSKQPSSKAKSGVKGDEDTEAGPSTMAATDEGVGAELSAPVLKQKLENLRLATENSKGETTAPVEADGPRFDSPFNSPTRSSTESDQPFHSLSSTPLQGDEVVENLLSKVDSVPVDHERVTLEEPIAVPDNGSNISSPSATFSVDSDDEEEGPSSETMPADSAPSEEGHAACVSTQSMESDVSCDVPGSAIETEHQIEVSALINEAETSHEVSAPSKGKTAREGISNLAEIGATGDVSTPADEKEATGDASTSGDEKEATGDVSTSGDEKEATGDVFTSGDEKGATGDVFTSGDEKGATGDVSAPADEKYAVSEVPVSLKDGETIQAWNVESSDHQRPSITLDIQAAENGKDLTGTNSNAPPLSPLNVSIDVVDHLEKCLAKIPNTLKLESPLDRLVNLDGEELLNMFYHDSVIRRVGNQKEELCHAMWTSLITITEPQVERPCLVLLSNQATYFVRADNDNDKYAITNISHSDLKEVSVGLRDQSVRLGGQAENDYHCCITRNPSLVQVFVTRVTFIVDTDYVRQSTEVPAPAPPITKQETAEDSTTESDSEEESIYDTKKNDSVVSGLPRHPSGVDFVYSETRCLADMRTFINSTRGDDLPLMSVDYIYLSSADHLKPSTMVLTSDMLYFIKESYMKCPVLAFSHTQPDYNNYVLERSVQVSDIRTYVFKKDLLRFDFLIGADVLTVYFCSIELAESFFKTFPTILTD